MTEPMAANHNPLYWDVSLSLTRELPVLGVPVRFASNSEAILEIVGRRFGRWAGIPERLISRDPVDVRLVLHEGREAPGSPITYRMPDETRLLLHTPGSLGLVDVERRDAIGYVSRDLLADVEHFGYGMLEAMTLQLVARRDRQPLHAAMIARGAVGLLLAGPTGVGKSTLAYAAHQAGWRVLSDDSVYVQRDPELRVWGAPGRMYLLAEARRHFPHVARRAQRLPSGKEKIVIDLDAAWHAGPPLVTRVGVCLLTRNGGGAARGAASDEEARAFLEAGLGMQAMWYGASLGPALAALCARGAWRLNLSSEPRDALPHLAAMLADLEAAAR